MLVILNGFWHCVRNLCSKCLIKSVKKKTIQCNVKMKQAKVVPYKQWYSLVLYIVYIRRLVCICDSAYIQAKQMHCKRFKVQFTCTISNRLTVCLICEQLCLVPAPVCDRGIATNIHPHAKNCILFSCACFCQLSTKNNNNET